MKNQNYILKNDRIKRKFMEFKKKNPDKFKKRLNLSWSNWMFGVEDLNISAKRLKEAGVDYIELHGNHYGENCRFPDIERALPFVFNSDSDSRSFRDGIIYSNAAHGEA